MGYYTVTELAKKLEMSRVWVSQQVTRGLIRGERVAKSIYLIPEAEAMLWIKKFREGYTFPRKKRNKSK